MLGGAEIDDGPTEEELGQQLEDDMDAENPDEAKAKGKEKPKPKPKKASRPKAGSAAPAAAPGTGVRRSSNKVSKPRRPFAKLTPEVLEERKGALRERLSVANAQITIMSSKLQKYEDESKYREEEQQAALRDPASFP